MSLKANIDAGLAAISPPNAPPFALDAKGAAVIPVPIPPALAQLTDGKLLVKVQVSRTGEHFSLYTALGRFKSAADNATLEALLQRNYYPDQTAGTTLAISPADDALVATYHWMLDSITPGDFTVLFTKFSSGVLDLLGAVVTMARTEPALEPAHPKAG